MEGNEFEDKLIGKIRDTLKSDQMNAAAVKPNWEVFNRYQIKKFGFLKWGTMFKTILVIVITTSSILGLKELRLNESTHGFPIENSIGLPDVEPNVGNEIVNGVTEKTDSLVNGKTEIKKAIDSNTKVAVKNEPEVRSDLSSGSLEFERQGKTDHQESKQTSYLYDAEIQSNSSIRAPLKSFGRGFQRPILIDWKVDDLFKPSLIKEALNIGLINDSLKLDESLKQKEEKAEIEKTSPWSVAMSYTPNIAYKDQFFLASIGVNYELEVLPNFLVSLGANYLYHEFRDYDTFRENERNWETFRDREIHGIELPFRLNFRISLFPKLDLRFIAGFNAFYVTKRSDLYEYQIFDTLNGDLLFDISTFNDLPFSTFSISNVEGGLSATVARWGKRHFRVTTTYASKNFDLVSAQHIRLGLSMSF